AEGHREEPRGLRQRGDGRRLPPGACAPEGEVEAGAPPVGGRQPIPGTAWAEDGQIKRRQRRERVAPQHRGPTPCDTAKATGKAKMSRIAAARVAAACSRAAAASLFRSAAAA